MRAKISAFAIAIVIAATGCGGGGAEASGGNGNGDGTSGGDVAEQYMGPVGSTDIAAGEAAYQAACAVCHDSGPNLENLGWGSGAMRQQIREGSGGMPPVPADRLSDEDMEHVLAYLTSIGGVSE